MDSAEEGAQEMTGELARWDLIMVYLKCACAWRYFSKGTDNMPHCRVSPRRCGHASLLIFFLSYSARFSFSSASILSFPLPLSFPPLSSRYIWANIHFVLKREYLCLTAFVVQHAVVTGAVCVFCLHERFNILGWILGHLGSIFNHITVHNFEI